MKHPLQPPHLTSVCYMAFLASAGTLCFATVGCGGGSTAITIATTVATPQSATFSGHVMEGQQPINGAAVQLYAAGHIGYGSAFSYANGTSLLGAHSVLTSGSGAFNLTGDYTCPPSNPEVYIEAIGGIPIAGEAANPNIILLAALGPCDSLPNASLITLNELTTVASIWALAPFMTGPANIGTSPTNPIGLTNAFASVNKLVNTVNGALSGPTLPAGATIPAAELNTLADILASCINSSGGGIAGDGSACGNLFALAVSSTGVQPTDVVTAALNIAHNPTRNSAALNRLAAANGPFQPILTTAPPAWTVAIQYAPASLSAPAGIAPDQSGNLWVANTSTRSVTLLNPTGAAFATYAVGQSGNGAIAIDLSGNAWVAPNTPGSLLEITPSGSIATATGGGLAITNSLAIDASGNVWAAGTSDRLSVFSSSGIPLSSTGYTGGLTIPQAIAITPQ